MAAARNQVRIIGGEWRSRLIAFAPRADLRPTPDRVRETLFNWLGQDLTGKCCLDLFAGSGALGIEALSRGASSCTFVERAPSALRSLRDNLARLGAPADCVRVRATDYQRALKADAARATLYNLVLVDAPYARYAAVEPVLAAVLRPVLAPRALVVVETARGQEVRLPLVERSVKLYGDTRVTFLSEV